MERMTGIEPALSAWEDTRRLCRVQRQRQSPSAAACDRPVSSHAWGPPGTRADLLIRRSGRWILRCPPVPIVGARCLYACAGVPSEKQPVAVGVAVNGRAGNGDCRMTSAMAGQGRSPRRGVEQARWFSAARVDCTPNRSECVPWADRSTAPGDGRGFLLASRPKAEGRTLGVSHLQCWVLLIPITRFYNNLQKLHRLRRPTFQTGAGQVRLGGTVAVQLAQRSREGAVVADPVKPAAVSPHSTGGLPPSRWPTVYARLMVAGGLHRLGAP